MVLINLLVNVPTVQESVNPGTFSGISHGRSDLREAQVTIGSYSDVALFNIFRNNVNFNVVRGLSKLMRRLINYFKPK